MFQIDEHSPVVRNVAYKSTPERHGRIRVAIDAFVRLIIKKALNDIPSNRRSARDGARYLAKNVNTTYSVFHDDWAIFPDKVAIHLALTNLADKTGMSFVRFYNVHGLRMTVDAGHQLLLQTLDVDNVHMDIVQVHKATSLSTNNEDDETLLVNFRQLSTSLSGENRCRQS